MDFFEYKGASLFCEELPLKELALTYGTPLYVYSEKTLSRHFRVFDEAMKGQDHLICFAVKANSNLAILRLLSNLGAGADVVSGGELFRALEAGIPAKKIVFSGVGKTLEEIQYALRKKTLLLNVESISEVHRISEVAKALGVRAPIGLRLNPDVDAKTHPYISTGMREHKFGLSQDDALQVLREAAKDPNLEPVGLGFHIGSQVLQTAPFEDSIRVAVDFVRRVRKEGIGIRVLDTGGGLGVTYMDESPPSPDTYAKALLPILKDLDLTWIIEPGRSLAANAGVLVTKVVGIKKTATKTFVIVDAGMNDLLRPALYKAEHRIEPISKRGGSTSKVDVVGPVCESSDFLAKDREIEECFEGDLLAVRTTGAYGFSMSSQYNGRPRAAEVLVHGDQADLIRSRETFEDLIRGEFIPERLKDSNEA